MENKHTIALTYDQVCILRTLVLSDLEDDYTTIKNITNKFGQGTDVSKKLINLTVGPIDDKAAIFAMLDAICDEVEPEAKIHVEDEIDG